MANGDNGGTPYGGEAWITNLVNQAVQAAMQRINWSQLMGYGYPSMYEPQAPTRADALMAIWENREDIRGFYLENWGESGPGNWWRPEDAMEKWLEETPELAYTINQGEIDPTTGEKAKETITRRYDPIEFAIEQGYIVDYSSEEGQATLDRERFEEATREFNETQLRLLGLDEEAIREFNDTMDLYRDQFDQDVREADRNYLRQLGLDEESIRRWDREQDRIEALDAEAIREANRAFLQQEGVNAEAIRQFNAEHDFARSQAEQQQANIEWDQLRAIGLDDQAAYEFQQTHDLAVAQFEAGNDQWWATFGLEQERFNVETQQWEKGFELEQQYFGLSEQELALQQLQTLLGFTGPANWPQYWAASRAMPQAWGPEGEPVPAWAQTLGEGGTYPGFGAAGQVPQGIYGGITPWQVSPEQWAGLSPSEIQGLSGQVQTGGGYMPDWMKAMQAGWPKGQATPISYFGA